MTIFLYNFYAFLNSYKYVALFLIAVPDGPIIALIAGFLISTGYFLFIPTYIILILGNVIPDICYYYIGRLGLKFKFLENYKDKFVPLEKLWQDHFKKTLVLGKLAMFFSVPVLISAGMAKVSFKKFITTTVPVDLLVIFILLSLGYFSGGAYQIYSKYIKYFGIVIAFVFLVIILFLKHFNKKIDDEIKKVEKE